MNTSMSARSGNIMVFAVTGGGLALAHKLQGRLDGVEAVPPHELKAGGLKAKAKKAFKASKALVFISACGIAVRTIAPLLKGKHLDPAVIVIDERGRFVISLVSGHLGGANRLTEKMAEILGAVPVITTATDLYGLPCAEDIAQKFECAIENTGLIKLVNSAILAGSKVFVIDENPLRRKAVKKEFKGAAFRFRAGFPEKHDRDSSFVLISSSLNPIPKKLSERTLVLRPKEIAVGVGCRRGVSKKEIACSIRGALEDAGLSPLSIKGLASIDIKNNEKGLISCGREFGVELRFYGKGDLEKVRFPSAVSGKVLEVTGVGCVCEPAALLLSGAKKLCLKKVKTEKVTIAAALAPFIS